MTAVVDFSKWRALEDPRDEASAHWVAELVGCHVSTVREELHRIRTGRRRPTDLRDRIRDALLDSVG